MIIVVLRKDVLMSPENHQLLFVRTYWHHIGSFWLEEIDTSTGGAGPPELGT